MEQPSLDDHCREARMMIECFFSVGVERFDVIHTDVDQVCHGYRRSQSVNDVRKSIPFLVPASLRRERNLIIRPRVPVNGAVLAQLDDLDGNQIERIRAIAFLILRTSPLKHQAWVAIAGGSKDIVRRLVQGVGGDARASGAVRLAGTRNYKRKYAPDFPTVAIIEIRDRLVEPGALDDSGYLAPKLPERPARDALPQSGANLHGPRSWPSYQQALSRASRKPDGGLDRSGVDFKWCIWAIDRGWTVEQTAAQLFLVSEKAQEELRRGNKEYARLTAWKASHAVWRKTDNNVERATVGECL